MSGAPLHAVAAWDISTSYGMPAINDDVDFEARAKTMLTETVRSRTAASAAADPPQ